MSVAGESSVLVTPKQDGPRARRVGIMSPPSAYFGFDTQQLEDLIAADYSLHLSSSPPASPPLPVRSPLRPMGRSVSGGSTSSAMTSTTPSTPATKPLRLRRPATPPPLDIEDFASIAEEPLPLTFQIHHRSFPTNLDDGAHTEDRPMGKGLPPAPRPESLSLSIEDEATSSSSSSMAQPEQVPMTKRQHALHELLSSERAYASDLALIREFHIPLALGKQVPLNISPLPTSPTPSSSSSRTVSTSSDSSTSSLGPPMTPEDTRTIFSNIAELAVFSDQLSDALEKALGNVLDGGEGEDRVGTLFLEIIPEMEKPYKYYITRHPSALTHLQNLPQSPALTEYMRRTQTVASNLSHAWDLSSLLIKPVQRLLKYSLLLGAIIDETPDTHGDKESLKEARVKMEEVARNVNEGRRRAEVVKEVLSAKKKTLGGTAGVGVGVAASVNLTKMKSLSRRPGMGAADGEVAQVERMHAELKRVDVFAQQFAKNVVDWARMMNNVVLALRKWALGFGKVIGLSAEQESEAFEAFVGVVEEQLVPLCHRLEKDVNDKLLREIAHLLTTMNQPLKLLASMNEQEPFHYHLLNMNVSAKNRPPASLLAASTNYLALRGQLATELPTYLKLLHQGLSVFVLRLAAIQATFWRDVRDRWADLWEMLRVEGEMNAGHTETTAVWQSRWYDVDEVMGALNITQAKKLYQEPLPKYAASTNLSPMLASLEPQFTPQVAGTGKGSASVVNVLGALDPHAVIVSSPQPLAKGSRPRGQSDASGTPGPKTPGVVSKKMSSDSVPSSSATVRPGTSVGPGGTKKGDGFMDFVAALPMQGTRTKSPHREHAPVSRTKSMPLDRPLSDRSSSSSNTNAIVNGPPSQAPDEDRGRPHHKPSLRRKFTNTLRQRSTSKNANVGPNTQYQHHVEPVLDPEHDLGSSSTIYSSNSFSPTSVPVPPPTPRLPQLQRNGHPNPNNNSNNGNGGRDRDRDRDRDSWMNRRAKYVCQVVHACRPPAAVSYFSFPFFTLGEGELFEVLHEAGHPSIHPKLPLYVDDGEDCLLLCRDGLGDVGWALASFLAPLEGPPFS